MITNGLLINLAFILGALSMYFGFRLGFYKDKGYYPTPDHSINIGLGTKKKSQKKEEKEEVKDWDRV